jgi:hypothetical protein
LLLALACDVEPNREPATNRSPSRVRFGCSAVDWAASIYDALAEFRLDFLPLSETRVTVDVTNTIEGHIAQSHYTVQNVHRSSTAIHLRQIALRRGTLRDSFCDSRKTSLNGCRLELSMPNIRVSDCNEDGTYIKELVPCFFSLPTPLLTLFIKAFSSFGLMLYVLEI